MFDQWLQKNRHQIANAFADLRLAQGDCRPRETLQQSAKFGIDQAIKSFLGEIDWSQTIRSEATRVLYTGGSIDSLYDSGRSLFLAIKQTLAKEPPLEAFEWLGIIGEYTLCRSETITKIMAENLFENKDALEYSNNATALQKPELKLSVSEQVIEPEKSEVMFRALTESMQAIVIIASLKEQRSIYANPAASEVTGYSFEELTAYPPLNLFTEESTAIRDEYIARYMRGQDVPSRTELEILTKSGESRWIETSWAIIDMGEDGPHKVTTSFDITDRKMAQDALKDSEKKFRVLAESTSAQIVIAQSDKFIYANKSALESYGLSWQEFSARSPHEMLSNHAHKAGHSALEKGKETGSSKFHFEFSETTKNQSKRWYEVMGTELEIDGIESWIWTSFDITDYKLAQEELKSSEERYRTIFDTAGTAMISFGEDKLITMANEEWIELSGFTKEETIGKLSWEPFFAEKSLKTSGSCREKRAINPNSVSNAYETEFVDRLGKIHDGIVNIQLIPGTKQRVASFQDLTQLKAAQKEMYRADKMAALGQIIAGVAHEINNPNNFIYFNLPILKRYIEGIRPLLEHHLDDDPDLKILNMPYDLFLQDVFKLLENMEHGSQRITGIVSELKNYVRSSEEVETKLVSVESLVNQVMSLIGKQVRKMVKHFDVEVTKDLPQIKVNPGKIEQLLINLAINAGQAANKKNSQVKLTVNQTLDSNFIVIKVEDNGAGILAENIEQVFEPFYTSKTRDEGTGLGLSISHRIVEEHGGSIEVSSEPDVKTCFTVHLPIRKPTTA